MSNKVRYTLWIDEELYKDLNIYCVMEDLKKNLLVEQLINKYLKEKNGTIKQKG